MNNVEFNLEFLIDEYSSYVFKIVNNLIGTSLSYQDKEEIVSDTFYLLWKNQAKIDTNLKSYLSAIARNCAYAKLRANKVELPLIENNIASYNTDFDSLIDIKDKLKKLSKEELNLFISFYLQGLKIKEISKINHKSISDIKIKLYRLRKKLKEE